MEGRMYLAIASDVEMRRRGECGGVVTALLKFLLESKTVNAVLAVKKRGNRYDGVSQLITDPEEVLECAGSLHCVSPNIAKNLKNYLDGAQNMKIAVVCKPCDARAIVELTKREQVNFENLILIGVNCTGIFPPNIAKRMLVEEYGVDPSEVVREDIDGKNLIITLRDGSRRMRDLEELERKGYGRRANCKRCDVKIPRMADLACGKWGAEKEDQTFVEVCSERGAEILENAVKSGYVIVEPPSREAIEERKRKETEAIEFARKERREEFAEIEKMNLEERFKYWNGYLERCVKCFGCRDVCPICYCRECYLEADRGLVKPGRIPPERMFPLVRIAHVADSCVNCGQCEDACPMEIPISKLCSMLNQYLSSMFRYIPGMDPREKPPLTMVTDGEFSVEDIDLFFNLKFVSGKPS